MSNIIINVALESLQNISYSYVDVPIMYTSPVQFCCFGINKKTHQQCK